MAIVKTLQEAIDTIAYLAGVKINSASSGTNRHETGALIPLINDAYVEMQEETIARDFTFYLQESSLASLPTSRAATGENYSTIEWPETAQLITRIDVLVSSEWSDLKPIAFDNIRSILPTRSTVRSPRPTHYSSREFASVAAATVSSGAIAIAPFCSSGQFKYTFLPRWTAITNVAHKFIFPSSSAFFWMCYQVVAMIACRDRNQAKRYQISTKERDGRASAMGRLLGKQNARGGTMRRPPRGRWG